jgi:hypothetical protein
VQLSIFTGTSPLQNQSLLLEAVKILWLLPLITQIDTNHVLFFRENLCNLPAGLSTEAGRRWIGWFVA